jgi:hypothetical protein
LFTHRTYRQAATHFGDTPLDCFLAAIEAGRESITARLTKAIDEAVEGSLETVLRAVIRTYLDTCARESDHTRAWVLELAAAGPEGVEARDRYLDGFAAVMRDIDRRYGSGTSRRPEHYVALVGGMSELVAREVRAGTKAALPQLEDALTAVAVTMPR